MPDMSGHDAPQRDDLHTLTLRELELQVAAAGVLISRRQLTRNVEEEHPIAPSNILASQMLQGRRLPYAACAKERSMLQAFVAREPELAAGLRRSNMTVGFHI